MLRLTRVLPTQYNLMLIPSDRWLDFLRLDTNYSWLHRTADSSSGAWMRIKADSILQLTMSCGWLEFRLLNKSYSWFHPTADYELRLTQVLKVGLDWRLTYTLIYQVNLRIYSAKYIIVMVYFLRPHFSYHWFRVWLLLQEPWRSLKKLQPSSCGWFDLRRLIRDLQPIDYLKKFDSDAPWHLTSSGLSHIIKEEEGHLAIRKHLRGITM